MQRAYRFINQTILATALAAAFAGAHAAPPLDTSANDQNPINGSGYFYFHEDKPVVDWGPNKFRRAQPHGLTDQELHALESQAPMWHPVPPGDKAPSQFHKNFPHGLSDKEIHALESEDPVWQTPDVATTGTTATPAVIRK